MIQHPDDIVKKKQKRNLLVVLSLIGVMGFLFLFMMGNSRPSSSENPIAEEEVIGLPSTGFDAREERLLDLEEGLASAKKSTQALFEQQMETKEILLDLRKEVLSNPKPPSEISLETLEELKQEILESASEREAIEPVHVAPRVAFAAEETTSNLNHVSASVPSGTIVRCVLTMGVDCHVGVSSSSDPALVRLRPLTTGKLPLGVRVPIKNAVILGKAVGNLSNERVRISVDKMTLVKSNGEYVETEIAGCVSGEDGREGMRGVVVDRSGKIISRASFAAFFQGVSSGLRAALNNQTLSKLSKESDSKVILDVDTFRDAGMQGATTGLDRIADYYIKRAEQVQPSIMIEAGRIVDVVFQDQAPFGQKDVKKKYEIERSLHEKKRRAM